MQKKWYIGTLITILSLLVVIQQQTVVPNQEISLDFVDADASSPEVQNAITVVTEQLQAIGVKNIRISNELEDGKLKITYYSDAEVAYIKKALSKEHNLDVVHVLNDQNQEKPQKSEDKDSKEYNLDVYEIHKGSDPYSDFDGKYVLEIKQEQKGNSDSTNYTITGAAVDARYLTQLVKLAQKINATAVIAIDNTSYNVPEVRAGPIA